MLRCKKHIVLVFGVMLAGGTFCAKGDVNLVPGRTEVVIAPTAPSVTRFAAEEMTNFLSRVFGVDVPLRTRPSGGGTASVILGTNVWSEAAGVHPEALPRDAYCIKTAPNRVHVAGYDDPCGDIIEMVRNNGFEMFERATLFATYDFLERFAGVRFYFPGELGEVVPHAERLVVPESDLKCVPKWTQRAYYMSGDGEGYAGCDAKFGTRGSGKRIQSLRLRYHTFKIPCCHGQNWYKITERFGAAHPEYLQLRPDGSRCTNLVERKPGDCSTRQLCHSSGVYDEFYKDIRAYFRGERAAEASNFRTDRDGTHYADLSAQDGMARCNCPECRAAYTDDPIDWASELVWKRTAEVARRLQAEGLAGYVTHGAYQPYRRLPSFKLPSNILVEVCEQGPWMVSHPDEFEAEVGRIRGWSEHVGRKVMIWTYPYKFGYFGKSVPDVPQHAPHAWMTFYKRVSPWIFGSFAESESDRWIYNYLNYRIFMRYAWEGEIDVDRELAEHHRLMFGEAAAGDMQSFYDLIEKLWMSGAVDHTYDSPIGPVVWPAEPKKLWGETYSPAALGRLDGHLRAAESKTSPGSLESRRVAFVRREFFAPLRARAEAKWRELGLTKAPADFVVTDYGAKADGSKCTAAFKRAVNACVAAGGGRVVVPAGTWFTGPVHLASAVELHLEKGAVLLLSDDPKDCLPVVRSSWEGLECLNYSPLVYAYGCTNVAITGEGTIRPKMDSWRKMMRESTTDIQGARAILYRWGSEDFPVEKRDIVKAHSAVMRPQCLQFNRCKGVRLEGVRIEDSPFWTIHLFLCEDVTIRRLDVNAYGFNNDGIDIEMTRNVLIEDCDISAGDDGFVLKAGRNRDAWRINRPTENVEIRNCRLRNATALLAVGSELSGGIRNVRVHDCTVGTVARVFYVKTNRRRGGFVDNVTVENVTVDSTVMLMEVATDVLYQWKVFPDYENRLTKISNLTLANVDCKGARVGVAIAGEPTLPVDGVTLRNVRIGTLQGFLSKVDGAENFRSENFVAGKRGPVTNPWDEAMPLMPAPTVKGAAKPTVASGWQGKKVAFIGDSITDPRHIGCTANYWNYLPKALGFDAYVYGVNGARLDGALEQAKKVMRDFHWYVDAIFVWAGTNDFNGSVPRGDWYDVTDVETPRTGGTVKLRRRLPSMDPATFRGRLNRLLSYLKHNFPDQQIVLVTAIHRGYATFGPKNIQPDESFPNLLGLYIDDYNDDIRQAGRIWSVPVLDLYARSGLLPTDDAYARYFHNAETDRLHPSANGHDRIARTMLRWMLTIPPDFKRNDGVFDM